MKYYAMIDGERCGPFALEELPAAGVRPSTYVWTKGMDDWEKAEDVADICRYYRNHIYDLMHPSSSHNEAEDDSVALRESDTDAPLNKFVRYFGEGDEIPSVEEINAREDISRPPHPNMALAILVTLFCCPPTGIAAIYLCHLCKKTWKKSQTVDKKDVADLQRASHDFCKASKMWTGISACLGLILYAFLIHML